MAPINGDRGGVHVEADPAQVAPPARGGDCQGLATTAARAERLDADDAEAAVAAVPSPPATQPAHTPKNKRKKTLGLE